jgi:tRNA (cmo5U34)-methyltransferase
MLGSVVSESPRSVQAFGVEHAKRYDRESDLGLMGDRARHRQYLHDLLKCVPEEPRAFVDLGCGTGFFTDVFFEVFPAIRGIGVDGSEAMLAEAKAQLDDAGYDLTFRRELLQSLDWASLGPIPLVFSALVVHHLSHEEKRNLLTRVFEHLEPGGTFILFDSFRPDDPLADGIIERLTAMQIHRDVEAVKGSAPPHEHIIGKDREVKEAEGDREASIEAALGWLREAGFHGVTTVFQELRFAGIVALKPG